MKFTDTNQRRAAFLGLIVFVSSAVIVLIGVSQASAQRAVWSAAPVNHTNGTVLKLPQKRPASRSNGLTFTIDTRWSQNYGYRPVEITIKALKPAPTDRLISLSLYAGWNGTMQVDQDILLPSGATSASATISVPQYQRDTQLYWWNVRVDGFLDKEISLKKEQSYSLMQGSYSVTSGASFLGMTHISGQRTTTAPNSSNFEILSLSALEFPKRWIDYTCLDAVTLSFNELALLRDANPEAFQAMQSWLRAGGQLWVNDMGDDFQQLPKLSKLLNLSEVVSRDVKLASDSPLKRDEKSVRVPTGWRPLDYVEGTPDGQVVTFQDQRTGAIRTERNPVTISRLQTDPNYFVVSQRFDAADENQGLVITGDSNKWFIDHPVGLGIVRAFRGTNDVSLFQKAPPAANANVAANEDEASGIPPSLEAALQSAGSWTSRHGIAPDDANSGFPDLLIPGLGLAPVTEFQILITLFVVLIGPLNYWLLKRWRRLHLMVLTVPLAAAAVTLALFAYAIISDGFGTTVRAHSFTTLDQRNGESACWARLSYYSGLAPRSGLKMPDDVALYPIIPNWSTNSSLAAVGIQRQMRWVGDDAHLTRGWLRSRTPTQYLTCRSRKTPLRLDFTPITDRLRIKNLLDTDIEFLVTVDANGKYWIGEDLPQQKLIFLQPIDRTAAERRFRRLVQDRAPRAPDALLGADPGASAFQRRQWQMMRGRSLMYTGSDSLQGNLANAALAALAGLDGREGLLLPPKTFVAVTTTAPEVVFGLPRVQEEESFHVITGQW